METEELLYKEIMLLRSEMKDFRDDLFSLKLKVYVFCAIIGATSGGITSKLVSTFFK